MSWREKATARRQALTAQIPLEWSIEPSTVANVLDVRAIPDTCGVLNAEDIQITKSLTSDLLSRIHDRTWTSERVMLAFCKRAVLAHQLVNCATNFLFDEALQVAKSHDEYFRATGRLKGPLHGLPVSIKVRIFSFRVDLPKI